MIFHYSRKHLLAITLAIFLAGTSPRMISGQNCGCAPNFCCSLSGYCGNTYDYCADGCQAGPCYTLPPTNISVPDIVTDAFFDGIANQAAANCTGKGFYTRAAFLEAIIFYQTFGTVGYSADDSKREIAAFFAHVTHETGHLCYIEEIDGPSKDYCNPIITEYPCAPGRGYYGRGPIQLTWNYNYGPAGNSIGFDGLNNPDIVARNNVVSFRTALWFWMNHCHYTISSGNGFGRTIMNINGNECNGGDPAAVRARIAYYTEYCNQLQVDPGDNLSC